MRKDRKHSDSFIAECKATVSAIRGRTHRLHGERDRIDGQIKELEERIAPYLEILRSSGIEPEAERIELSHADRALLILQESDKPLHARQIWHRMAESGAETKSENPVNMLSAVLSQDDRFKKTNPRTFTLALDVEEAE